MSSYFEELIDSIVHFDNVKTALYARMADVGNRKQDRQYNLLLIALHHKNYEAANILMDSGLNIDAVGDNGATNLVATVTWENLEVTKLLLDRGAQPNYYYESFGTVLHLAAQKGDVKMCKLLVEYGAIPDDKRDQHGFTAYNWACRQGGDLTADFLEEVRNRVMGVS